MRLISQHPHANACAMACIAMLANVDLEAVLALSGSERASYATRKMLFEHFGLKLPGDGYIVETFGNQTMACLMKQHTTLLCSVYSCTDTNFAHYVIVHEGHLYDPWDGIDPSWPWHRYIGQAEIVTAL